MGVLTDIGRGIQGYGQYRRGREKDELAQQLAQVQMDRESRLFQQQTEQHERLMFNDKVDRREKQLLGAPMEGGLRVSAQQKATDWDGTGYESYLKPEMIPDLNQELVPDDGDESMLWGDASAQVPSGGFESTPYLPPALKAALASQAGQNSRFQDGLDYKFKSLENTINQGNRQGDYRDIMAGIAGIAAGTGRQRADDDRRETAQAHALRLRNQAWAAAKAQTEAVLDGEFGVTREQREKYLNDAFTKELDMLIQNSDIGAEAPPGPFDTPGASPASRRRPSNSRFLK